MCSLGESQTAVFDIGQTCGGEFNFQFIGMSPWAEKNGYIIETNAFIMEFKNLADNEVRLLLFAFRLDKQRFLLTVNAAV